MDNIVSVKLDSRYASTLGVWQYDYGQVLRITGPELPPAVEVQFSLNEKSGETLSRVGTTVDGVTEVKIPDELLTHSATSNYRIYAYIYLTDETSGNTKYEITIPVRVRSKPTSPAEDPETDPDLFRETVVAVNASAKRAENAASSAMESAASADETLAEIKRVADGISGNIENANTMKSELSDMINNAGIEKKELESSIGKAGEAKMVLDSSIRSAGEKQLALDATVEHANTVDASLKEHIGSAEQIQANVEQIANNKEDIGSLQEDTAVLQKRQNILVGSETGNPVSCNDAYSAPLCGLTVYGKSTQDGKPTPDAPVPIVSAGDGGTIVVTLSDGNGKTQTLTLPTPTGLPGIPVTSGGNYTDQNGHRWICDEVDLDRGMMVQRVGKVEVTSAMYNKISSMNAWDTIGLDKVQPFRFNSIYTIRDSMIICTALPGVVNGEAWSRTYECIGYVGRTEVYIDFCIANERLGTTAETTRVDAIKALMKWLETNPFSFIYVLTTPIETPLTPAEITAYKALITYAPNTVAQASDDAGIKLDYQRDVNLVVNNLEDAIASMTTT